MSKLSIDQIIKKALRAIEQREAANNPPPFDSMSDRLDQEAFDGFVKDEMESMQPLNPNAWEEFEDEHAEKIGLEHPIDRFAAQQVGSNPGSQRAEEWSTVSAELSRQAANERKVLIGKGVELTLMLLILWWALGQFSIRERPENAVVSDSTVKANPTSTIQKEKAMQSNFEDSDMRNSRTQPLVSSSPDTPTHSHSNNGLAAASHGPENTNENKNTPGNNTYDLPSERIAARKLRSSRQSESRESQDEVKKAGNRLSISVPDKVSKHNNLSISDEIVINSSGESERNSLFETSEWQKAVAVPLLAFSFSFPDFNLPAKHLLPAQIRDTYKKTFIPSIRPRLNKKEEIEKTHSIALSSGWQINQITTETDPLYPIPATTSFSNNMTLGLEWEERSGNNAFGLSANYQRWDYEAPRFEELYQSNSGEDLQYITLEAMTFDMLSFQVFGRKYFPLPGRLEGFLHFGGGLRLSLRSEYDIKEGRFQNGDNNAPELTEEELADLPSRPRLWNKTFQEGLFEGGGINENSFMTLNLGGGVAYKYNEQWQIEFMPIFILSPFADGMGPNRDKINSLILQFQLRRALQ